MDDRTKKQASQYRPGSGVPSTESLNAMSPAELADALEQTLDAMTEEDCDPDLIDAYLDALDQKAPMPEPPDVEESFKEFKQKLQELSSLGEAMELPEPHKKAPAAKSGRYPFKRVMITVAATVALLLALMVGAQAAGLDIFGRLAQWTDEVFFFLPASENPQNAEACAAFQQALEEQGLPKDFAPTWYPEGFTAKEARIWDNEMSISVELPFTSEDGKSFAVSVDRYKDLACMQTPFEKDARPVETYVGNNRAFYIMSNINTISAAWADNDLMQTIIGELSVDEIKQMIHSMGG